MAASTTSANTTRVSSSSRKALWLIGVCFTLSGAAALIYEVLWMRMLGLVFGATTIAVSVVLAAFMGGLALGSAIAGKVAGRIERPLRAYALIEIGIGLYALAVSSAFRAIDRFDAALWQQIHPGTLRFALIRFALAAIALLIPTALMGATLPIMVAAICRYGVGSARTTISRLYGLNLTGAIAGTLVAGFVLLPTFGVQVTIWIAALTNVMIGILVLLLQRRAHSNSGNAVAHPAHMRRGESDAMPSLAAPTNRSFWFVSAFASGFVTIGMQVVWSRILAMIIGSSTYAFTLVLALSLVGLAIGAWIVSSTATADGRRLRRFIFAVQLLIVLSLFVSFRLTSSVPAVLISIGFRLAINSWHGLLALQSLAAAILILVPALLMGMIMPLALVWTADASKHSPANLVGQTYALNTLGAISGSIATTFVLIPMANTRFAVFTMAAISITIAAIAYQPIRQDADVAVARSLAVGLAAALIIAALFIWPRLNLNELSVGAYDSFVRVLAQSRSVPDQQNRPNDHRLLMYDEGRTATVSVRRDWGITSVAINGRTNASDADDMPTQILLGQLGVLIAPRLDNALLVGFASGVTAGSVLQSQVKSVECVELERAAISSSRYFEHVNNHPLNDSRLRMIVDDARTYLRVNQTKYDLIVSEPSHPWVPGVANLFTREFFTLGRERLKDGGVFVQWIQIYQLSTESLRSILATFHEAFPHVAVFRVEGPAKGKDLILLGSRTQIELNRITQRLSDPLSRAELNRVGLRSADDVLTWFVCDEERLGPAIAGAVINTDDNMRVETVAPREAFRPTMEENSTWIERLRLPKNR
jgi:spermidine synthase